MLAGVIDVKSRGAWVRKHPPEIAAGTMQLIPLGSPRDNLALAALGRAVVEAPMAWVARDCVTALPRAYVALNWSPCGDARVASAPGITGTDQDADDAGAVVARFAQSGLGLNFAR